MAYNIEQIARDISEKYHIDNKTALITVQSVAGLLKSDEESVVDSYLDLYEKENEKARKITRDVIQKLEKGNGLVGMILDEIESGNIGIIEKIKERRRKRT